MPQEFGLWRVDDRPVRALPLGARVFAHIVVDGESRPMKLRARLTIEEVSRHFGIAGEPGDA